MARSPLPHLLALLLALTVTAAAGEPPPSAYAPARQLCTLANAAIDESSGLAASRRRDGVFWTHNDSGDGPRLYAFNRKGEHLATITVGGAVARDWEDMASFTLRGKPWLLVGDVGDNARARRHSTLYVEFTYAGGALNCEAVAIDAHGKTALVIDKAPRPTCRVFAVPLKANERDRPWVVKPIATLTIPTVTAMDVSPDGLRAIVLTYAHACEYARKPGETWADAFARAPRVVKLPGRRQGESICYGRDGKALYLTSEKTPTPLFEVPLLREGEAPAEPPG